MSLRSFQRLRSSTAGFSLVEMLVAMMFIGILSAGMMRIYSTNLAGFQRVNDNIGSQRRGRWALATLQDDVESIGFFAFVGFNNLAAGNFSVASGTQEPFMILPGPTPVLITGPDPNNLGGPLKAANLPTNPDELQYVSDLSLPIQANLDPNGVSTTTLTLTTTSGSIADLQPGDIVAIMDGNFEQFLVSNTTGTKTVNVDLTGTTLAQTMGGMYQLNLPGSKTHVGTPPLAFYRPSVVTRYSIQAQSWDPSNPLITIPCLMRQQTPYPAGGTLVNWAAVPGTVVAENIEGFHVDLSFNGGNTWRTTTDGTFGGTRVPWGDPPSPCIVSNITSALVPAFVATGKPCRDTANPLWFRTYPFLIRMDIVSRSAAPRSESTNQVGKADYVRRTQTLLVSPRNFGFSL
jgi:hypothetical protein